MRLSRWVAPLVIGCLLAPTLIGRDRLAFRDVSHFYTPLYGYLAERSAGQWIPLWNPLDQTGMPLLGETTTAFFYPPRYLLFALPWSAETAMAWYVAVHLIGAAWGAAGLARREGIPPACQAVAGLTYSLSGAVLFLYSNPPFLVGAAWLPTAIGALLGVGSESNWRRAAIGGCALAMMVLGGDPQTALHAVLVAAGVQLVRVIARRPRQPGWWQPLLVSPLLAGCLAAPQIVSSVHWSWQSERLVQREEATWWRPPVVGSRRHSSFAFSVPPWHWLELSTPNAFGRLFPRYRRVEHLAPGPPRLWTPTLYAGTFTLLALTARLLSLRRQGCDRWMAITVAGLLAASGSYGLVWWIQALTGTLSHVDSAFGGPYWLLYQFLPGYDAFRYPAKWLPLASLGAALVTARWLDRLESGATATRRALQAWAVLLAVALGVLVVELAFPGLLLGGRLDEPQRWPSDHFWGPLQWRAGLRGIAGSLIHSLLALAVIAGLLRAFSRSRERSPENLRPVAAIRKAFVAIVAADLAIAAAPLIARVPRTAERSLLRCLSESAEPPPAAERWLRTRSGAGWPAEWRRTADRHRLLEVEASQRAAWFGRWHLAEGQAVFNNMVSIRSRDIEQFWAAMRRLTSDPDVDGQQAWRAVRNWLAIGGVSNTTTRNSLCQWNGIDFRLVELRRDATPLGRPPLRFETRWQAAQPGPSTPEQWLKRLREVGGDAPIRVAAAVPSRLGGKAPPLGDPSPQIRLLSQTPERVDVEVETTQAGWLTRPVYQDGCWQAELTDYRARTRVPAPVAKVDFLKQGTFVPPGRWVVTFRYRPAWLVPALAIAVLAWAGVLAGAIAAGRGGRRSLGQPVGDHLGDDHRDRGESREQDQPPQAAFPGGR